MKSIAVAATLMMTASAPAFAGSIDLSTLNTQGQATDSTGTVVLTPNNTQFAAGSAYLNNALALDPGANISESFTFSIASPTSGPTANGFAFFLSTNPVGTGLSNGNLGLTSSDTLAVEFYDFGNKVQNPVIPGTNPPVYNSNLVAAIQNGNTLVQGNPAGSYGSPGPQSCVGAQTSGNGCMNNGDVWTADITYVAGKLTVSLADAGGAFVTVISNYAIALGGSSLFAGFSGSTGNATDSVSILSWSQSVPEPMTLGVFGAGLSALGFARRRRAV